MTQNEAIIKYLKTHVAITQWQATEKLGILRLSARIHDLREMGYKITALEREVKTKYGTSRVAEYRLEH